MSATYTVFTDIAGLEETPTDGTFSRTLHNDERAKIVLFSFRAGQELSEHTASSPAVIHFLTGDSDVTLGSEKVSAGAGTWIHMPANLPHSIRTKAPVVMLLTLFKSPA